MEKSPLIPFCRIYENVSAKGNRYLVGNLTYTSKIVGFLEETDDGQTLWQLYIQERPPRSPVPPTEQPAAGDHGGIEGGDYPLRTGKK